MTVEVKVEETQMVDEVVVAKEEPKAVEKCPSYKEESNYLSDLKDFEKTALNELKEKLEEAILGNSLFKKEEVKKNEKGGNEAEEKEKAVAEEKEKEKEKEKGKEAEIQVEETEKPVEEGDAKPEKEEEKEKGKEAEIQVEETEKPVEEGDAKPEKEKPVEEGDAKPEKEEEKPVEEGDAKPEKEEEKPEGDDKEKTAKEGDEEMKTEEQCVEVDMDIALWGVPLLPSKAADGLEVILLKFLRAREFKVHDAFEMLKKTLQWRKENNIDSILGENLGADLGSAAYMNGVDREGHPVCYNIFGVFESEELYQKTFGNAEKRAEFLRWRLRLMEEGIEKLDLKPGGVSSLLQINDLKNSPGPTRKELRVAMKQAVGLLQDNYPEFVAKNIFINVPFWYYALRALLSPFLTQRTKSKFVVSRPSKVTETLLKYIPVEELPIQYGGFKRENDFEFSSEDSSVSEITVKAGSTETIEITADEVETTTTWDLTVLGWEVNYKEEYVPADEGSYTVIVQKGKKMSSHEEPIRNTFNSTEPGKVVLTIENTSSKKKRVLYRHKTKKSARY